MVFLFQGEKARPFAFCPTSSLELPDCSRSARTLQVDENCTRWRGKKEPPRPRGSWLRRIQSLVLLSLAIFTQWVRSKNTAYACNTNWPRQIPVPLFSRQFIRSTPGYSWRQKKIHLTYYHRGWKMVPLREHDTEKSLRIKSTTWSKSKLHSRIRMM